MIMSEVLAAKERTDFRKSNLRMLREQGSIPAVVYGVNMESKSVEIVGKELIKTIRDNGRNGIISLDVAGNSCDVILTDYQTDPINKEILHADFLAVDMNTEVQVQVRVQLDGEAAGVKDGGVLQQPLHEVSISATPDHIPQAIHVDVASLQVGEHYTIADISMDHSFSINHDVDEVIVSILPPKVEKEISTGEQQDGGIPDHLEGRETSLE
jgi:large subunit ribosomal protein L25